MGNYVEERPWGKFEILLDEEYTKVKRITVSPSKRLSLQSHQKRDECWTIVQGSGLMTLGVMKSPLESEEGNQISKTFRVSYGEVVNIYCPAMHRIENDGEEDLVFIEVQTGTYFGEDDIQRFEDDYGRE
jgi:mannose-6-phosphate isomerase-like protein (cupin superfamily)